MSQLCAIRRTMLWPIALSVAFSCSAFSGSRVLSQDTDFSQQLPRIEPKNPAKAIETFQLAGGFRLELVAAEPLVVDPVAMAFDEHGRLFVVEMRGYSENRDARLGRVRLLEDIDGDGRMDRSEVYADGFSWPTAVTCFDGGIFVGAAPDIYYLKDTDGDNRADVRKAVFTGFGHTNVQGLLNTFLWGLHNRIHGATSSSGGIVRPVAATATYQLDLRGRDFSFDPLELNIMATSGGGQHGMTFNRWGNRFVCSNSDHVQQILFEDRYLTANPFVRLGSPRRSIAGDGPQAEVYRSSPVEPWRTLRTRLRVEGIVPGIVEGGGRAAGYFTSATGLTVYQGDAWPDVAEDWAIVADVGSNLVHRKRLEPMPDGTFVAHRVDEKAEFITSSDIWFRPVQFCNAPDGTLYLADMYREVVEHPMSLPPSIKKHLDLDSGRDRGRIYRIVQEGFAQPPDRTLGDATTSQLVAALSHKNGWHRETAARLIYERQDRTVAEALREVALRGDLPEGRIRALYALSGLASLDKQTLERALRDDHPQVRRHALVLAEGRATASNTLLPVVCAMADDKDLRVLVQLAFSLGRMRGRDRDLALARLMQRTDGGERLETAILSALGHGAGAILYAVSPRASDDLTSIHEHWLPLLARQIASQRDPQDIAKLLELLGELPSDAMPIAALIVQGCGAGKGSELSRKMDAASGGLTLHALDAILAVAARGALDSKAEEPDRIDAIQRLRLGSFSDASKTLRSLLAPHESPEIQLAALRAVATLDDIGTATLLLDSVDALGPSVKREAINVLLSRDAWIVLALRAVEEGTLNAGDIDATRWADLSNHFASFSFSADIRTTAAAILERNQRAREEVLQKYREVLSMSGDAEKGRGVFRLSCAPCHQLDGYGQEIAPNLAATLHKSAEAVLLHILLPNLEVNPQYRSYVITDVDGRIYTGMIAAETATSITLMRADRATDEILRKDIDECRSSGLSLMPEGLEKDIDRQAMADLIAYLQKER